MLAKIAQTEYKTTYEAMSHYDALGLGNVGDAANI
jgi:hypothetical protein